jgi:hypothetical protein
VVDSTIIPAAIASDPKAGFKDLLQASQEKD